METKLPHYSKEINIGFLLCRRAVVTALKADRFGSHACVIFYFIIIYEIDMHMHLHIHIGSCV